MQLKPPIATLMLPQRALCETLTVAEGVAAKEIRLQVDDDRITPERVEATALHVP